MKDLNKEMDELIKRREKLVVRRTTIELGIPNSKEELEIIDEKINQ